MAGDGQLVLSRVLCRLPLWGSWTRSGLRGRGYQKDSRELRDMSHQLETIIGYKFKNPELLETPANQEVAY